MSIQVFQNIKDAISNLNPEDIRRHTDRPVRFFLYADREQDYRAMEQFLVPEDLSRAKRAQVLRLLYRASEGELPSHQNDLEIYFDQSGDPGLAAASVFAFDPASPRATIHQVLGSRPDLAVPLALHALPFAKKSRAVW